MHKRAVALLVFFALVTLAACSSGGNKQSEGTSPQPSPAEQKKPAANDYISGREAFQKLYVASRSFAADVKPYRLESSYTKDAPAQQGKAALWRASFASPSRNSIKTYSWSGLTGPDAPDRGVSPGTEDTYNPSNTSTQVFDPQYLKTDSGKAFEEAQKHGGDKLMKADPKQPVFYVLEWVPKTSKLIWRVNYGSNRNDVKLAVDVDATTGAFLRVEK